MMNLNLYIHAPVQVLKKNNYSHRLHNTLLDWRGNIYKIDCSKRTYIIADSVCLFKNEQKASIGNFLKIFHDCILKKKEKKMKNFDQYKFS